MELLLRLIIINKRIKVGRYVEDVKKIVVVETIASALPEPIECAELTNK